VNNKNVAVIIIIWYWFCKKSGVSSPHPNYFQRIKMQGGQCPAKSLPRWADAYTTHPVPIIETITAALIIIKYARLKSPIQHHFKPLLNVSVNSLILYFFPFSYTGTMHCCFQTSLTDLV